MDYAQALKATSTAKKPSENYLTIKLAYDSYIVLPYAAGVEMLKSLQLAERVKRGYGEQVGISPIDSDMFLVSPMSRDEYLNYKMAMLMGCTLDQVKAASTAVPQEEVTA